MSGLVFFFRFIFFNFEALAQFGKLEGDGDGKSGDDESVEEKGDEARSLGKIGFDVTFDNFFNDLVPGQSGDEAETGGGER